MVAAVLAALGIIAFARPGPPLNDQHLFETDPLADQGEHRSRHEHPGEGPTVRLADTWLPQSEQ